MRGVRWAGIIAAGEGSRLGKSHPGLPKPLVPVAGRPLVHWVASSLRAAGVRHLWVLLNSRGDAVRSALRRSAEGMRVRFLRRDTASSWESFRLVSRVLAREAPRFLVSTVDAIVPPADARRFAGESFARWGSAGGGSIPAAALGLTRFVDDEKPLWADFDASGRVRGLGEDAARKRAVTCGLYALSAGAAGKLPGARRHGRLRDFWIDLVRSGAAVRGVMLSKTVDVDRPEDIPAAERVIRCFDA